MDSQVRGRPSAQGSQANSAGAHIPQLDGIRGIAILLVMVTHFVGFEPWTMTDRLAMKVSDLGWIGVDLFFVLSGFLISGLLYDSKGAPRYFRDFFKRRSLRIFPLYFLFVGLLALTAYVVVPEWPESKQWRQSQGWYWGYAVNFLLATEGTWAAGPLHSGHLWSLAIEEHFYLLWPLLIWRLNRKQIIAACLAIMVGALALRIGLRLADRNSLALFVMTPTRIDSLAAGALGAMLARGTSQIALKRITMSAVAIGSTVFLAVLVYQRGGQQYSLPMQTVGYTALAIAFAGFVTAAAQSARARPILGAPALAFWGRYSYALYMFHGFCFVVVESLLPPIAAAPGVTVLPLILGRAVLAGALSVAVALVSWNVIEKRFLALRPRTKMGATADQSGLPQSTTNQ